MADPYAILEKNVLLYDTVLLFRESDLLVEFCRMIAVKTVKKTVLVLSQWPVNATAENITFHQLTPEEAGRLTVLYYTYEFSDNFLYVSQENAVYAGLYNFVRTGVLSPEEFFGALLF